MHIFLRKNVYETSDNNEDRWHFSRGRNIDGPYSRRRVRLSHKLCVELYHLVSLT
jgi:hypothetical protein